jgi:hypothetical protein
MKTILALVLSVATLTTHAESQIQDFHSHNPNTDLAVINKVWQYVKREAGADPNLPAPKIWVSGSTSKKYEMATSYPTAKIPNGALGIFIQPDVDRKMSRQLYTWELGHEMMHYILILKENGWNTKKAVYQDKAKHHCDPEFQRITLGVADVIAEAYRSRLELSEMYYRVDHNCFVQPDQ